MISPLIVVGVDGSLSSQATLRWAAAEAVHRGLELLVVHAFDWRLTGSRAAPGSQYVEDAWSQAEAVVASAAAEARTAFPGLNVRTEPVLGPAGHTLVRASEKAELVVVGNRGRGGFASLLLGSVGHQVATHAAGPVVVVRGRADIDSGDIVVGADGSEGSSQALRAAFEEALARGAGIVAVRAYLPTNPSWSMGAPPYVEDRDERRTAEKAALAEEIAPWQDKYPGVPVEQVTAIGTAAQVLTGMSSTAQLVVVGTRGHGGFTGLLLGSVGLQLLHHAQCPVLIARPVASPSHQ
jgi:nucleotide-binding universal stress UspA family protein